MLLPAEVLILLPAKALMLQPAKALMLLLFVVLVFVPVITLTSPPDISTNKASVAVNKSFNVFYTNVDQFLNKHDLLLAQIRGHSTPDIIIITEVLPKAPSAVLNLHYLVTCCI